MGRWCSTLDLNWGCPLDFSPSIASHCALSPANSEWYHSIIVALGQVAVIKRNRGIRHIEELEIIVQWGLSSISSLRVSCPTPSFKRGRWFFLDFGISASQSEGGIGCFPQTEAFCPAIALLLAEGVDGVEFGGLGGGVDSEDDAGEA